MEIILLLVLISIIAAFTIIGFNKGFLRTLVSMSAIIIGIIFVSLFGSAVTRWVDTNTSLRTTVREAAYEKLSARAMEEYAESSQEQKEAVSGEFVPESVLNAVEATEETVKKAAEGYVSALADKVADNAVSAAGFLLTLALAFVVTRIILLISKVVSRIPIVGGINRLFGGVLGLARGAIIVCLIFLLITMFQYTSIGESLMRAIVNNKVLSFMYETALKIKSFFI